MRTRPWTLALSMLVVGCGAATPEAKYGHEAIYSPTHRAYVVTRVDLAKVAVSIGTAAGPSGPDVLVFRDPLTDNKIRCRDQLLTWLDAEARATNNQVRSGHDLNRSFLIMFPFTTAMGLAVLPVVPLFGLSTLPHLIADYPSEQTFYQQGARAFAAGRYAEARDALETSVAADRFYKGRNAYALYYLGLAYEQLRQDDLARQALLDFVQRSMVADATAYQGAEDRLVRLGVVLPACESTAPVTFAWGG